MEQSLTGVWKWLESTFPPSRFLRRVVRHPFDTFQARITSGDFEFTKRIAESLYAGDFLILTKAAMPEALWEVRKKLFQWGKKTPQGSPTIFEQCPNAHFDHTYYFYRWNADAFGVFTILDRVWKVVKVLSGPAPVQLTDARAQEELVECAQVIHCPPGSGAITIHPDPSAFQKINFGFPLTIAGKDYSVGGTYVMVTPNEKHNVERYVEPGDGVMFSPSLWHGVDKIDPGKKSDGTKLDGRWYMGGFTTQPDGATSRQTSLGLPSVDLIPEV